MDDFDAFIEELKKQPNPAVGELFIFVDECHRTQSGKLHKTMKALLPGAVFVGFTGTPLLIAVDVVRKGIKNLHLSVHPPTGRVRIAAPERMSEDAVRVFAISELPWIRQQQGKLQGQERESAREYLDRESHFVWGKRYLLQLTEEDGAPSVELKHSRMTLRVRPGTDAGKRQAILEEWLREELREAILFRQAAVQAFLSKSFAQLGNDPVGRVA